MKSDVKALH